MELVPEKGQYETDLAPLRDKGVFERTARMATQVGRAERQVSLKKGSRRNGETS